MTVEAKQASALADTLKIELKIWLKMWRSRKGYSPMPKLVHDHLTLNLGIHDKELEARRPENEPMPKTAVN